VASTNRFDGFTVADFPPCGTGSLPKTPDGYVYVFCWIRDGVESAFYVGQTKRLAGRMNDYRLAQFAACTDFRVGEAVRYLRDTKKCRIVVRYKVSTDIRKDEYSVIRELHLSGVRLLNDFSSYDYRMANETEERAAVQGFCDVILSKSVFWKADEIGGHASELPMVEGLAAKGRSVLKETNHDRYVEAFRGHADEEFSTADILKVLKARYGEEFSAGSNRPNDHAEGNKSDCACARTDRRIFDRLKRNLYRVRPSSPR
jgi:hypothetical protein